MRVLSWCGVALLTYSTAEAQVVRGTVVDGNAATVSGVVIAVLDSASNTVARALSNDRGEYRVQLPSSGTFRLRTLRIGYRPTLSPPVVVNGSVLERRIVLEGLPIALDTLRVDARGVCHTVGDSAAATYTVWDQVHAALTATQLTTSAQTLHATLVAYERVLDPASHRIAKQQARVLSGTVSQPWRARETDSLHRAGYVAVSDSVVLYYAPGIETLLSDVFLEDHCFHLLRRDDLVGIAFEPIAERRDLPDITGTLWLDHATTELRRLDFHYVNMSELPPSDAGGEVAFVRLRDGEWAVGRWTITMPVFARTVGRNARDGPFRLVETELRVSGGDLVLARRASDTLWSRPAERLRGEVVDSVSEESVAGAHVALAGTSLGAVSDARGRFAIEGVLPGDYVMEVSTLSLDSVPALHQMPVSLADVSHDVRVKVPTGAQIISAICRGVPLKPGDPSGVLLGRVVLGGPSIDSTSLLANVAVTAEWTETALRGTPTAPDVQHLPEVVETHSDAHGNFRFCGVPTQTPIEVTIADDTLRGPPTQAEIPAGQRIARADVQAERLGADWASLLGSVLDVATNAPVATAQVQLLDLTRVAFGDQRGEFRMDAIEPGPHHLLVRRIGYSPLDTTITFVAGHRLDRKIFLASVAMLDSVVTTASNILRSFEENRRVGLGHFFTRAELEAQHVQYLAQALDFVPGAKVARGYYSYAWMTSANGALKGGKLIMPEVTDKKYRGAPPACYARVFLNHTEVYHGRDGEPLFDINSIPVNLIEAMEYYSGPAETPLEYSGLDTQCGVLVIWTRVTYP